MDERILDIPTTSRRIEHRAVDAQADPAGGFDGYASTFWNVDSYGTAFAPGAFSKTLAERGDKTVVLWQHDPYQPIGKPTRMAEDGRGLAVTARISDGTRAGAEAMALLRDGVPLGLSVGFRTLRERPADPARDPLILDGAPAVIQANPEQAVVIEEARLYEFSVVSFPANEAAQIAAVRADAQLDALAGLLADLRAGRLGPAARAIVEDLVAAWQGGPDGASAEPPAAVTPRRRIDAETVLARWGHVMSTMEGQAWA